MLARCPARESLADRGVSVPSRSHRSIRRAGRDTPGGCDSVKESKRPADGGSSVGPRGGRLGRQAFGRLGRCVSARASASASASAASASARLVGARSATSASAAAALGVSAIGLVDRLGGGGLLGGLVGGDGLGDLRDRLGRGSLLGGLGLGDRLVDLDGVRRPRAPRWPRSRRPRRRVVELLGRGRLDDRLVAATSSTISSIASAAAASSAASSAATVSTIGLDRLRGGRLVATGLASSASARSRLVGDGLDDLGRLARRRPSRRPSAVLASSDAASCSRTWANAAASVLSMPPSGSWTASAIE